MLWIKLSKRQQKPNTTVKNRVTKEQRQQPQHAWKQNKNQNTFFEEKEKRRRKLLYLFIFDLLLHSLIEKKQNKTKQNKNNPKQNIVPVKHNAK